MRWAQVAVLVALLFVSTRADLPVHCLHSQVVGTWVLYLDNGGQDNSVTCGHSMPDRDDDHVDHELRLSTNHPRQLEVDLKEPSVVTTSDGDRGHWTMIYDEGFEVVIGGYNYFAFSHYHSNIRGGGATVSDCDRTFVGWYHRVNGSDWGCYYGVKKGAKDVERNPMANRPKSTEEKWAHDVDFQHMITAKKSPDAGVNATDMVSFLELINTSQSNFRVKYHDHFRGLSYNHLQQLAGASFLQTDVSLRPLAAGEKTHTHSHAHAHSHSRSHLGNFNVSDLPKNWDWRNLNGQNYDSPFKYQGFCGSCYSMATVQMLETRVRIMTNNTRKVVLSSQDAVSCSRYNQGCDGGYPFLVSKYARDFGGIVPDSCLQYAPGTACSRKCSNPSYKVTVSEYYYVGGYYGGCNEGEMMQELVENGPFVVSFNAGSDFMFYSGGVYTQSQFSESFLEISSESSAPVSVREWEKTTHSVLLVGYGENEADGKYWIAKNTWGAQWGESGYFRIRKGTDESAFESMSLAARAVLIEIGNNADFEKAFDSSSQSDTTSHSQTFGDSDMLEEGEGLEDRDSSSASDDPALQEAAQGRGISAEVKGLEKEMDQYRDEDFMKEYPSIRHKKGTNDLGVKLRQDDEVGVGDGGRYTSNWNDDHAYTADAAVLPVQAQDTNGAGRHHHHHHHHSGPGQSAEESGHHHHRHYQSRAPTALMPTLIEGIQLDEGQGVGEFADPADDY